MKNGRKRGMVTGATYLSGAAPYARRVAVARSPHRQPTARHSPHRAATSALV